MRAVVLTGPSGVCNGKIGGRTDSGFASKDRVVHDPRGQRLGDRGRRAQCHRHALPEVAAQCQEIGNVHLPVVIEIPTVPSRLASPSKVYLTSIVLASMLGASASAESA